MICFDSDDFGANHVISDMCQSHDCRDKLDEFHYVNPNFKATLFAIPAEMTFELAEWCKANEQWIELAVHGIKHSSNYECDKMTYEEFDMALKPLEVMLDTYFVKGFKAPGWQISDGVYRWLVDHGWWVADQAYNNNRRPGELNAYINNNGEFKTCINGILSDTITARHHHTWDCMGNGVYEQSDYIKDLISRHDDFKFVSEILNEANNNEERTYDNG